MSASVMNSRNMVCVIVHDKRAGTIARCALRRA